jgi:hypothetical protein
MSVKSSQGVSSATRTPEQKKIDEKFDKGSIGAGGVENPATLKETDWLPVNKFMTNNKVKGNPDLFHHGNPGAIATQQGDLGNCYFDSSDAGVANTDPNLARERVRPVGEVTKNGQTVKLYAVLMFAKQDSDAAKHFQRAAPDVTHSVTLPDPNDVTKTLTKTKTSTPVWIVVSDEVPVEKDGQTLNSSDVRVKGEGAVLSHFLTEKAEAMLHFGTYRNMNNGGDAATALEELTGYPAVTADVSRSKNADTDKQMAIDQFNAIAKHTQGGGIFVFGTWGNNDPSKSSLADNDSIKRIIRDFPQYSEDGKALPLGQGFFKPDFEFRDGTGTADHGSAKESASADRKGSNSVGDHDQTGVEAKYLNGKNAASAGLGDMQIAFRNPWGSTRPIAFSDGKARDDGVSDGKWGILRTLVGTVSFGGRPRSEQNQWMQNLTRPDLPADAKRVPDKDFLLPGETLAK